MGTRVRSVRNERLSMPSPPEVASKDPSRQQTRAASAGDGAPPEEHAHAMGRLAFQANAVAASQ
jgi:hypothetical protein